MQRLKVIYHSQYEEDYPTASVERPERVEVIRKELQGTFEFMRPRAVTEEDILMVHGASLYREVKGLGLLFEVASRAVGGAIQDVVDEVRGYPPVRKLTG